MALLGRFDIGLMDLENAVDFGTMWLEECLVTKEEETGLNPKAVVEAARRRAALVGNFIR